MLLTTLLVMAAGLGTGILTARILGPEGRGELAAITIWPQTVAYMATLGIPGALIYYLRTSPQNGGQVLTGAVVLSIVQGFIATIVGVAIAIPVTVAHFGPTVLQEAQLFMLLAPAGLIGLVALGGLQAGLEFRKSNAMALGPPALTLLALLALASVRHLTPVTAALATALPSLLVTAWVTRYLFRRYGSSRTGLLPWFKRLLGYGFRAYPLDLIGTVAASIDQAIVVGFVGPAALGWYVVALRGSRIVSSLQQAVAPVVFTRAAGRPKEEVVAITGRSVRVTIFLAAVCGGILMIGATQILGVIYGKAYVPAATVFRLLVLEALLSGVVWILGMAFFALGRPGTVASFQALGVAVLICLLLVLVPRFGVVGAGLALLLSTLLRLVFMVAAYPLILRVRAPSLVLRREDMSWVREALQFREHLGN